MQAFNLPNTFINTVKALYQNAMTQVVINGFLSDPYKVTHGIRQGDPLSCTLVDLVIEPLVCMIREEPNFKGITLPDQCHQSFYSIISVDLILTDDHILWMGPSAGYMYLDILLVSKPIS